MTRAGQRAGQAGPAARVRRNWRQSAERRGESLDAGLTRLQGAAARDCPALEDLLSSIVTELTGGSPTDDIALIGLRWLN